MSDELPKELQKALNALRLELPSSVWASFSKTLREAWNARSSSTEEMREVTIDCAASLAAAISLLEKSRSIHKKAAWSDKVFDQMLLDYKKSLSRARAALKENTSEEK